MGFENSKLQALQAKATTVDGGDNVSFKDIVHSGDNSGRVLDQESLGYGSESFGRSLDTENIQRDHRDSQFQNSLEESEGTLLLHYQ